MHVLLFGDEGLSQGSLLAYYLIVHLKEMLQELVLKTLFTLAIWLPAMSKKDIVFMHTHCGSPHEVQVCGAEFLEYECFVQAQLCATKNHMIRRFSGQATCTLR